LRFDRTVLARRPQRSFALISSSLAHQDQSQKLLRAEKAYRA
jgi:hypothetical protein